MDQLQNKLRSIESLLRPSRQQLVMEGLQSLGGNIPVDGGVVKLPTAGTLTLLEAVKHPWMKGDENCSLSGAAACRILSEREKEVGLAMLVSGMEDPFKSYCEYNQLEEVSSEMAEASSASLTFAVTGFNMFPKGSSDENQDDSDDSPMYGSEWLATISCVMGKCGVRPFEAIWREPLVRVGFVLAQVAKENGAKNISRSNTVDWTQAYEMMENQADSPDNIKG